ncbi:hypothetical protein DRE_07344 [Drechslerella stenobrocha 248]|uniref:WSC domain-containing protein n=1 Tax=Drechslerella stenobrocha 248 TaxID=1043628 RepID=W7HL60_9PEZI|nr:hypothetical protein DRE_07344 [Drechslerella stenobrocha 248]
MAVLSVVLASAALLPSVLASGMQYSGATHTLNKRSYKPHWGLCPYDFTDFVSLGCYNDPNGKTLRFNPQVNGPDMTIEKCWSACKNNGFRYAGLEYYTRCVCGSYIADTQWTETGIAGQGCSYACAGNKAQICGGKNVISVYVDPTYPVLSAAELATAGTGYDALGCFSEISGRTLTDDQPDINGALMTVEVCLNRCGQQGYAYAGVENGQECWCAGKLPAEAIQYDTDAKCNKPCKGDASQKCGGSSTIYIYYNEDLDTPDPCDDDSGPGTTTTAPPVDTTTSSTTTEETTSTTTTEETTTTEATTTTEETTTTTTTTSPTTTTTTTTTRTTTTRTTTTSCRTVCGGYCAPSLPTFTDKPSCEKLATKCWEQVDECQSRAQNPGECYKLATGCAVYSKYCQIKCVGRKCDKKDCDGWNGQYPPPKPPGPWKPTKGPKPPVHTPTSTNNVCATPTAYPNPVGGCKFPVVSCNDDRTDYNRGNPFKVFSSWKSSQCASYDRGSVSQACIEACNVQYENCRIQYAGSTNKPKMNKYFKLHKKSQEPALEKKGLFFNINIGWDWISSNNYNTYNNACEQCKKQRDACVAAQRSINGNKFCKKFGYFKK